MPNPINTALLLSADVRIALFKLKVELDKVIDDDHRKMMLDRFDIAYNGSYELDEILNRYKPKG